MANPTYLDLTILTKSDVCIAQPNTREIGLSNDFAAGHSEAGSKLGFDLGDRVFHQKFGYGVISGIDGNKLSIQFEEAGPRRVVDSFVEKI